MRQGSPELTDVALQVVYNACSVLPTKLCRQRWKQTMMFSGILIPQSACSFPPHCHASWDEQIDFLHVVQVLCKFVLLLSLHMNLLVLSLLTKVAPLGRIPMVITYPSLLPFLCGPLFLGQVAQLTLIVSERIALCISVYLVHCAILNLQQHTLNINQFSVNKSYMNI